MFLQSGRRMAQVIAAGIISVGLLSGCGGEVTVEVPSVSVPPLPTIDIDTTKSAKEQIAELQAIYCKVRKSPIADATADEIKAIWNGIVQRNPDVLLPAFNPDDPKMCESA